MRIRDLDHQEQTMNDMARTIDYLTRRQAHHIAAQLIPTPRRPGDDTSPPDSGEPPGNQKK